MIASDRSDAEARAYDLKLSATQRAFVDDPRPYVLLLGGVGSGKSHAGAVRALSRRFGRARPGLGLVIAPTYKILRDASWRTALEVWEPLVRSATVNDMRIVLTTGDEVLFRSSDDPEHLRGPNAAWAWIDEAGLCHPSTWPITIGRLRQHGVLGEAWLTTTPKGLNWVYEVFVERATEQTGVHRLATWANPFVEQAFTEALLSQYDGEWARQEIEAEFIADVAGALLEWRWLDEAQQRPAAYLPDGGPVVGGVDVAGPGEAETVLCLRQAGAILEIVAFPDADARGAVIAALAPWRHRGLERVNVDSAGIGHYLARALEDADLPVRDVNVGEAPTTDAAREKYKNLKAELFWGLRLRFEEADVWGLEDRATLSQLASLRYTHDGRGRVEIESKADAQKRGVKSPDRAEAVMLAFAPPHPNEARAKLYGLRTGARR
jgi:phage terminase large subunit-like protein